tara:strand:- start:138 stop:434 length:297 start_codon:yes stop_codon:yes gene_type:complete
MVRMVDHYSSIKKELSVSIDGLVRTPREPIHLMFENEDGVGTMSVLVHETKYFFGDEPPKAPVCSEADFLRVYRQITTEGYGVCLVGSKKVELTPPDE